jgi:hypothetical protein
MKPFVGWTRVAVMGVLSLQLCVAVFAQEEKREQDLGASPQSSPTSQTGAGRGSTGMAAAKPGQADGMGNPRLGGERRPLYRLNRSDVVALSFTLSPEFGPDSHHTTGWICHPEGRGARARSGAHASRSSGWQWGRFSPEKGCHLLVEAYEKLDTDIKLVMAGAASYCDEYSRRLQAHAGERIKRQDWVSGEALDELLTNAMVFVLPSDLEGLSLALLDAMGAGLCVSAATLRKIGRQSITQVSLSGVAALQIWRTACDS